MANDKNKKDLTNAKRDGESMDDYEARTKTMTEEERAALTPDELSDSMDSADSAKGD